MGLPGWQRQALSLFSDSRNFLRQPLCLHVFCCSIQKNQIIFVMKSGFVELVVKVAKKDRKALSQFNRKRYNPLEAFKTFTQSILPAIEQRIEVDMLKRRLSKMTSRVAKEQLINAYLRRLMRLRFYEEQEIKSYRKFRPLDSQEMLQLTDPSTLKNLNEQSFYDVGYYTQFLPEDMDKYFKHDCFGYYKQHEYYGTQKFGVLIREESIKIVDALKRVQKGMQVDWAKIMSMGKEEQREFVDDENHYIHLFEELSNYVYELVKPLRGNESFKRTWGSSVVSDTLVNSVLNNLDKVTDPKAVLKAAVEWVNNLEVPPSPGDFNKRYQKIDDPEVGKLIKKEGDSKELPVLPLVNRLSHAASYFWDTPSFKNIFLGGQGGTGRSMILAYISMWAFKNNWVVINVPNSYKILNEVGTNYRKVYTGLFLTPDHAKNWLQQFRSANLQFLRSTPVNMSLYGKCDITGRHEDQYEPVPDLFDPARQVHFKEVDKLGIPDDAEEEIRDRKMRMSIQLPEPKTLDDICAAGVGNDQLATCAIAEVLEQVYELDVPTLVCVDGFNWMYRPSDFRAIRYYNDRGLFGRVPPCHVALTRLFMDLDGHRIKKGLKVVAASNTPLFKHKFDIGKLMFPKEYEHKVMPLKPNEFLNAAKWNIKTSWWSADEIMTENLGYMYTICQGNWQDFQEAIRFGHYY